MNKRLVVVGVAGLARSGKDTIASILCLRHGFTRVALADGVRSAFDDIDGPTWELRKELEAAGQPCRRSLQLLGTECREDVGHPRLWIGLLLAKIAYLHRYHPVQRDRFVVPDIRFTAEHLELSHDVVIRLDGSFRLWKVQRDGAGLTGDLSRHSSESQIDSIPADFTLSNNGSVADLEGAVNSLIQSMEYV